MIGNKKVLLKLAKCVSENLPVALVTVIEADGSSPRGIGSLMLVDQKGELLAGTVGGGALEEKAKQDAIKCIRHKASKLIAYDLGSEELQMTCGGSTRLFINVISPKNRLIIAGGGHIGHKLASLATIMDYDVTVIDDRPEALLKEDYPKSAKLIPGEIPNELAKVRIDENTCLVIVTYGHKYDEDCLKIVAGSAAGYLGMIGSVNKVNTCFENLTKQGVSKQQLSRVYSPIGLDLGGETPEEIALAIIAEMQAVRYKKNACHLRDKAKGGCKNAF